jgi:tripartite-type tricarboxylate transporter receptor subunit TctC
MVRTGTPPAVIERVHSAIAKVLSQPDTRKRIMDIGYQPIGNSPSEFSEYVRSETRRVAKVVQAAHIHLQ